MKPKGNFREEKMKNMLRRILKAEMFKKPFLLLIDDVLDLPVGQLKFLSNSLVGDPVQQSPFQNRTVTL